MPQSIDPDVLSSIAVTFGLATIMMVLRMVARRITRVKLWWDDYLAMLAWAFACAWAPVVLNWSAHYGLGHLLEDLDMPKEEALTQARFHLYLAELFYAFSLAFSKMSILCFYWRLFSKSNIRLPIQILLGASIVWLIIRTFMAIFHCVPVQAFWDHSIEGSVCNINDSKFFFGTVLAHLLIDLAVLALPIVQVKHLQLRLGQKVGVIALFMFGILVCIASVVVLVESLKFNPLSTEMPLEIEPIMTWATTEVNLAIASACLPMMRPVVRKVLPGSMLASDPSKPLSGIGNSKGIKLSTMTRSGEIDDNSSTRELADVEGGSSGSGEYDRQVGPGYRGPKTTITSPVRDTDNSGEASKQQRGIRVKNEMTVHYERAST